MKNHVGFDSDEYTLEIKLQLSYHSFWNLDDQAFGNQSTVTKKNQVVISPVKINRRMILNVSTQKKGYTHKTFLTRLYTYGLGNLPDNVCEVIKEKNCIMFFFGFIVVSLGEKALKPFWN